MLKITLNKVFRAIALKQDDTISSQNPFSVFFLKFYFGRFKTEIIFFYFESRFLRLWHSCSKYFQACWQLLIIFREKVQSAFYLKHVRGQAVASKTESLKSTLWQSMFFLKWKQATFLLFYHMFLAAEEMPAFRLPPGGTFDGMQQPILWQGCLVETDCWIESHEVYLLRRTKKYVQIWPAYLHCTYSVREWPDSSNIHSKESSMKITLFFHRTSRKESTISPFCGYYCISK